MKHTGLVSLCLLGRVRGERPGLKVTVRREPTAGLSLYAWSSPLTDFLLSWPFGQGFYKLPTHPSRGSSASDFQSRSVRSLELRGGGRGEDISGKAFLENGVLYLFPFASCELLSTVVFTTV